MTYRARVVDEEFNHALRSAGAVVIEGPRACGKTETARQRARSEVRLDIDANARQAVVLDPKLVLGGAVPRLIDEWQVEPAIWNQVRREVDDRGEPGQFILTGSATPREDETRHSGAGRFVHLRMRTMTLSESGDSTNAISFAALLAGGASSAEDPGLSIPALAERVAVGGWPSHLGLNADQAQRVLRGYLRDVSTADVRRIDGVRRDPNSVRRLIQSLARNVGTPATIQSLLDDANGLDGSMKIETARTYLDVLSRLFISDDVPAWSPSLRSRTRLRAAAIRHLTDPSLAVAAMNASPERLLADLNWFGFLFESMVIRDLRVYAQALGAEVFHYRDENGLEADAIIELPDGGWAGFEIKLGGGSAVVDSAASNLLALRAKVERSPLALGIITGTGYGLTRRDGVHQVPIGALSA